MSTDNDLEPIEPDRAVELYLSQKTDDVSDRTVQAHEYRLKHFLRWCRTEEIENLNELTGRSLFEFREWRKNDGDLNEVSVRTQMTTLRVFIRFCESIDAVRQGLHEQVMVPSVGDDDVRDEYLAPERAEQILEYLHRYEYASLTHTIFSTLWHTSIRMGALRALDVSDFDSQEQYLRLRHRPEKGTCLKNGSTSERLIAINDETTRILKDWVENMRPSVTDEYGRSPLVATDQGRISGSHLRALIYSVTRPCYIEDECRCDGEYGYTGASKCDHSRSPHCLRKGSLTDHLRNEVPKDILSERADCSSDVLDRWYNQMTESEQMEQRRNALGLD
jgi:integrase